MSPLRIHAASLAGVAALFAGCKPLNFGHGSGPVGIEITYNGLTEAYQTYECAALNLAATAQFDGNNNADDDVTTRVHWTSSNPGIIDVSNGEVEAEPGSGTTFPSGTVIARAPGSAVIRADYVGLTAAFSVSADPIAQLNITPELTRLAPGSEQVFQLDVRLAEDDIPLDLTSTAVWTLPTADAPAQLTGSTLAIDTEPVDQPFVLEARLFTCDRQADRELSLGALRVLSLTYEQPPYLDVPLGYSDEIRVEAAFEDDAAPMQNLSGQVEIEQILGDADYASVAVGEYLTVAGTRADVASKFRVRYAPLDWAVDTRTYVFTDAELQHLRVTPHRSDLVYPDTLDLQAIGLFSDGYERPVRRDVRWTSLNEDLVSVEDGGPDSGEVTPLGLEGDATVEVGASNSEGAVTAQSDIRVNVP